MEGQSKLKIGKKEVHEMGDPWPHLEVKRSKVKVTRPLYAVTENQQYLRNRRHASQHLQGAGARSGGRAAQSFFISHGTKCSQRQQHFFM